MERIDNRQGFLISALVHLGIMMVLARRPELGQAVAKEVKEVAPPEVSRRVFLPPPSVLRRIAPLPPRTSSPPPPPPEARPKERISIGGPGARAEGPLILKRDEEIASGPKGRIDGGTSSQQPAPPTPPPLEKASGSERAAGQRPALANDGRLVAPDLSRVGPASPGDDPTGRGRKDAARARPSIAQSLRAFEERIESQPLGLPTGTGTQMGPLFFDPQGADFTEWINHFRQEVYRNWLIPQPAYVGFRGHVDLEFVVSRDGSVSGLQLLKPSGTPAFDRAAQNALLGSRLLALPRDFAPLTVTMQVTFFYNERPTGS